VPAVIHLDEVTAADLGRHGILADQNIDSVATLSERAHLHLVQTDWFPEGLDDLFIDEGIQQFALVLFHVIRLIALPYYFSQPQRRAVVAIICRCPSGKSPAIGRAGVRSGFG
jgi:hypothetical protein